MTSSNSKEKNSSSSNLCDFKGVVSWTTTTAKQETFSHCWNIDGISHILTRTEASCLISSDFKGGKTSGHTWYLQANLNHHDAFGGYYYLSLYLVFKSIGKKTNGDNVIAGYQFTLLDANNQPLKQCGNQVNRHDFLKQKFGQKEYILRIDELTNPNNKYIDGDQLRIHCQVWLDGELKNHTESIRNIVEVVPRKDLCEDFKRLFTNSSFHDVVITTASRKEFKAHKAILSARSSVFAAMLQTEMSEAISGVVEINDFEDDIVKEMLHYIYCGELETVHEGQTLDLLRIADMYDIKSLKDKCLQKIPCILCAENAVDILVVIDLYNLPELKSKLISYIIANIETVKKTKAFNNLVNVNGALMMELFHEMF